MAKDDYFTDLWPPDESSLFAGDDSLCEYAKHFLEWAENLLADVNAEPDLVAINQAKVQLIDRYFEWRATVSKFHRNRVSETGHTCIFHVFERTYYTLRAGELSLEPPLLFIPKPPPPTPPPEKIFTPLLLGEDKEKKREENDSQSPKDD